jgi:hypothetical protein
MRRTALTGLFFVAVILSCVLAFRHPTTLNAQSPVSWVTVRDNREQAFSIEVPKRWKVYGGMFRFSNVDARPYVDMTSPDGKSNIRVGDATIPGYATPSPFLPRQSPRVAPYAPGDVFATKYGQARFSSMCRSVQVHDTHPMTPKYHQPGQGLIRTTGGETIFTCSDKGQPMAGYVYAETMLVGTGGPNSQWYVLALGSFLAPVEQAKAVGEMLKHTGESLRLNPEWAKMEQQLVDQETARINAATRASIATGEAQRAHQAKIMGMQQQENDNFNDVINGVTFTRDPQTGQTREVQTRQGGPYWTNGLGTVVNSTMSPGPAYHQLQVISR